MEYSADNYVLIKDRDPDLGYIIMSKQRHFVTTETDEHAKVLVEKLLKEGAKIYTNHAEYDKDYPPETITFEEKREKSVEFWEKNIPETKWPDDVKKIIQNKRERIKGK